MLSNHGHDLDQQPKWAAENLILTHSTYLQKSEDFKCYQIIATESRTFYTVSIHPSITEFKELSHHRFHSICHRITGTGTGTGTTDESIYYYRGRCKILWLSKPRVVRTGQIGANIVPHLWAGFSDLALEEAVPLFASLDRFRSFRLWLSFLCCWSPGEILGEL